MSNPFWPQTRDTVGFFHAGSIVKGGTASGDRNAYGGQDKGSREETKETGSDCEDTIEEEESYEACDDGTDEDERDEVDCDAEEVHGDAEEVDCDTEDDTDGDADEGEEEDDCTMEREVDEPEEALAACDGMLLDGGARANRNASGGNGKSS